MHAFTIRDDTSEASSRSCNTIYTSISTSTAAAPFRRSWSLARRDNPIHYRDRDDLSEYSSFSGWSDGTTALSTFNSRLASDGLQIKRTAAEVMARAEWERQLDAESKLRGNRCQFACIQPRTAFRRMCRGLRHRRPSAQRSNVMFTWSEVQSLVLLPAGPCPPYLMVITTYRLPEEKEWLLQAGNQRARALWAIEIVHAILRAKTAEKKGESVKCVGCSKDCARLPEAFLMDAARVACETARCQPTPAGMETLAEVLYYLAGSKQCECNGPAKESCRVLTAPHIPHTAFQRFGDAVKRAQVEFVEWEKWRVMARLLKAPAGLDSTIWKTVLLPYLWPRDLFEHTYPVGVDNQMKIASERCQRTLS
eukprot:TRINITY_DN16220_c0_g1_i1.p1 TRINITY_DN16220_c0_g1~~TRINITY_DN16220_c0_g1_i1.p1  ORF type:complete len:366 (+),score=49.45 TRINITY_DN16220_c0_g1_i1:249-1346(+)